MWRLLLIGSALAIAAVLIARWWFGMRVLRSEGPRPCRCDLDRWFPPSADTTVVHRAEGTAAEFGEQLRLKALAEWLSENPKAARSRENSRRFGMAVPPLSGIIAIFAVVVGKIPIIGSFAAVLAATALASVFGILSLAPELQAINRAAKKLREGGGFNRRDDEDAVIRCAVAHAWKNTLPPILSLLQR